jgi:hypothetical protein
MRRRRALAVLALVAAFPSASPAQDSTEKALDLIGGFADRICATVPTAGGAISVELGGRAKAELADVVTKLAELGIDGAATFKSQTYQNVLQQDLANALKSAQDCRLQIWKDLKARFQLDASTKASAASLRREITDLQDRLGRARQESVTLRQRYERFRIEGQNQRMIIERLREEQQRYNRSTARGRAEYERISQQIAQVRGSRMENYTLQDGERAEALRVQIARDEALLAGREAELRELRGE